MNKTWNCSLRVIALALSAALALAPGAQAGAFTVRSGSLEGTVTLVGDDRPASGVQVQVFDIDTGELVVSTETDAQGGLSLPDLRAGTYHLAVKGPAGYVASATPLVTIREGATATVAISLAQQQGAEWFDYAIKDTASRVEGTSIFTGVCDTEVVVNENTAWLGDLVSTDAIAQALSGGANVCMAYEGAQQEDGTFLATAIFAQTCTDELARAFESESACAGGTTYGTAAILAALLGAGALALGITQIADDGDDPDVVTQ